MDKIVSNVELVSIIDNDFIKFFLCYQNSEDYDSIILSKKYMSSESEFRKKFFNELEELEEIKNFTIKNHEDIYQMTINEYLKNQINY